MKKLSSICTIFFTFFLFSCNSQIKIINLDNKNFSIELNTQTNKSISHLINSLSQDENSTTNQIVIFDKDAIYAELANQNLQNLSVNTKQTSDSEVLNIKFVINLIQNNFIKKNSSNEFTINITRELLQNLLLANDSTLEHYINLLVAPCFTNEELTQNEYIDLLESLYGTELVDEIKNEKIKIYYNNSLIKEIGLIELLVLETDITFVLKTK